MVWKNEELFTREKTNSSWALPSEDIVFLEWINLLIILVVKIIFALLIWTHAVPIIIPSVSHTLYNILSETRRGWKFELKMEESVQIFSLDESHWDYLHNTPLSYLFGTPLYFSSGIRWGFSLGANYTIVNHGETWHTPRFHHTNVLSTKTDKIWFNIIQS